MEAATAAASEEQLSAEQLDQELVQAAAERHATIASIGEEIRPAVDAALKEGRIAEGDEGDLEAELRALQGRRMAEINNDGSVHVAHLEPNVLGYYDGQHITLATHGIRHHIYAHERDHQRVGMPDHDLDADLTPDTGIQRVDEQLEKLDVNFRDHLEDSATDAEQAAGGRGSELYLATHVAKVHGIEQDGKEAGVDMKRAAEKLLETHDVEAYQQSLVRLATHRALMEEEQAPEALAEIARDTNEAGVDTETRDTVKDAAEERFALAA